MYADYLRKKLIGNLIAPFIYYIMLHFKNEKQ